MPRRDAIRIPVGKTPTSPRPSRATSTRSSSAKPRPGRHVVRLKGGDPYVFGRGGEEQAALEAAGIAVEVVPGITAALGCAASIGLPLTQRGQNTAFTLITGASEDGLAEQDWEALAQAGPAFAIYMGVNVAGDIAAKLLDAGIDPPDAGHHRRERHARERAHHSRPAIGDLWADGREQGVYGPAIIYVGLPRRRLGRHRALPGPRRRVPSRRSI